MVQIIKIKGSSGSAAPATLSQRELAYSQGSDTLYIGDFTTANTPIPIGPAIKNNAGTPTLATGILASEIRTLIGVDAAGTDNSTAQNLFSTFNADGATSTSADTPTDALTVAGGTAITTSISGDILTINFTGTQATGAELENLVEDTTPQLGGVLDVQGFGINTSTVNGDVSIDANGTGNVVLSGQSFPNSDGGLDQYLRTDGAGNLSWQTISTVDEDVTVANLQTRLGQISTATTIGTGASADFTFVSDVIIAGDLTVSGTTTTVNSETVLIADNIITLNSNEVGAPTQNAGIEVERGTSDNVSLRWNETTDSWQITTDGTTYNDIVTSATQGGVSSISVSSPITDSGTASVPIVGLDLSLLTDMTAAMTATDELVVLDAGLQRRKALNEIDLALFNNSAGWTSNNGDITQIAITSTDGSITGVGTTSSGDATFDLEVGTIDGGTYV